MAYQSKWRNIYGIVNIWGKKKVLFFSSNFAGQLSLKWAWRKLEQNNGLQTCHGFYRYMYLFLACIYCLWHVLADTLINHNMKKNSPQCRSCLILTTCWFFFDVKSKFWFAEDRGGCSQQKDHWLLLSIDISLQLSVQRCSELRRIKDASAQNSRRCISYFLLSKVLNLVCLVLYVLWEVYINYSEYTKKFALGNDSVVLRWFSLRWFPLYYAMSCWWKMTPQKPILNWVTAIAKRRQPISVMVQQNNIIRTMWFSFLLFPWPEAKSTCFLLKEQFTPKTNKKTFWR